MFLLTFISLFEYFEENYFQFYFSINVVVAAFLSKFKIKIIYEFMFYFKH